MSDFRFQLLCTSSVLAVRFLARKADQLSFGRTGLTSAVCSPLFECAQHLRRSMRGWIEYSSPCTQQNRVGGAWLGGVA